LAVSLLVEETGENHRPVASQVTFQSSFEDIDQSDSSSWCVLSFNTLRFGKIIADWSVENMNSGVTSYEMS
jgi:hypothetical protein